MELGILGLDSARRLVFEFMTLSDRLSVGLLIALIAMAGTAMWLRPPEMTTMAPRADFATPVAVSVSYNYASPATFEADIDPGNKLLVLASGVDRTSAIELSDAFARIGYDLNSVREGADRVPRLFLTSLPADIGDVRETATRKNIFFRTVLPLILQVNEEILTQRKRLWELRFKSRIGQPLRAADRLWLMVMAERYKTKSNDIDALLSRVDVIPPSLALAQAAEESGWGTSRFAREGNALFGQWVFTDKTHLKPKQREAGKRHQVMAFHSLFAAARAYAQNLNTHLAYKSFRQKRSNMRRSGGPLDGHQLAGALQRYSERGDEYIKSLRIIITVNGLEALDEARLHDAAISVQPSI